jgi:hypothetical protein
LEEEFGTVGIDRNIAPFVANEQAGLVKPLHKMR